MSRSGAAGDTATARVSFLFATGASFILLAAILASQAAADGFGLLARIRAAVLADFLAGLPREVRHAVEFRHASWWTDEAYEVLLYSDERFGKLFKLKAHLQETMPRTPENVLVYLTLAATVIREAGLPPFDALAGDATLHVPDGIDHRGERGAQLM